MTTSSPDTSGEWRHVGKQEPHGSRADVSCVYCLRPWPCDAETMRRLRLEAEALVQSRTDQRDAATQRADRAKAALRYVAGECDKIVKDRPVAWDWPIGVLGEYARAVLESET